MAYLVYEFGDGMSSEERDRLHHAELFDRMTSKDYGHEGVKYALKVFHDRAYGESDSCRWCLEMELSNRNKRIGVSTSDMINLERSFSRPHSRTEEEIEESRRYAESMEDLDLPNDKCFDCCLRAAVNLKRKQSKDFQRGSNK